MSWCHCSTYHHVTGTFQGTMADLSRATQIQSTEWSLYPQVFKWICQMWFTPHTTPHCHLSEPQTSYVCIPSSRPTDLENFLNIDWLGITTYAPSHGSPTQGDPENNPYNCLIILIAPRLARNALVWGPSAALNGDLTPTLRVNNTSQAVPQPSVSLRSTTSRVFMPDAFEQTAPGTRLICGSGHENCCPSKAIDKDCLQAKVGPI